MLAGSRAARGRRTETAVIPRVSKRMAAQLRGFPSRERTFVVMTVLSLPKTRPRSVADPVRVSTRSGDVNDSFPA